jgi:(p)ppGpp synthase/HD superfamily hydrolase
MFFKSTKLSPRFEAAFRLTMELHNGQLRKGTNTPYLSHLLAVASLVLDYGGSEDEAIAALLHDAVEDQGGLTTLARIRREFGDEIAAVVDACSDSYTWLKSPWRSRKEKFIASLPGAAESVRRIMAADKLHNVRSILQDYRIHGEQVWRKFMGGRDGTLWYYRAALDALRQSGNSPILDELERELSDLERLAAAVIKG